MKHTMWALTAAVLLTAAGCGGHTRAVATTTAAPPPVSSSTTAAPGSTTVVPASSVPSSTVPVTTTAPAINTSVIPPVITVPYVNAVLAQLNHVYGNAVRLAAKSGTVPPTALADLRSIFNDPEFENQVNILTQAIVQPLVNVRRPPGDRVARVVSLLSASDNCVFVRTETSYSNVDITTVPNSGTEFYELRPKQRKADPGHLNGTIWSIAMTQSFTTNIYPPNPCGV
jgi:hypothetical protein